MVEGRDGEFELLRHEYHAVQIDRLVAMIMNLNLASQGVDHAFPLQVLRELAKTFPFTLQSCAAVDILFLLNLPGLFVCRSHGPDIVHPSVVVP
jgi:hypothetical protein